MNERIVFGLYQSCVNREYCGGVCGECVGDWNRVW